MLIRLCLCFLLLSQSLWAKSYEGPKQVIVEGASFSQVNNLEQSIMRDEVLEVWTADEPAPYWAGYKIPNQLIGRRIYIQASMRVLKGSARLVVYDKQTEKIVAQSASIKAIDGIYNRNEFDILQLTTKLAIVKNREYILAVQLQKNAKKPRAHAWINKLYINCMNCE